MTTTKEQAEKYFSLPPGSLMYVKEDEYTYKPSIRLPESKWSKPMSTTDLINDRETTHGNWQAQSLLACSLKDTMRQLRVASVTEQHVEALEMIAVKISRILCGDPNLEDHWDDIAGYAMLGKQK